MKPAVTKEVFAAAKDARFKIMQYVQWPVEAENWLTENTITHKFENGDEVSAIVINGKFYSANYFVAAQKENFDIEEENWNALRTEFNF